jgi:hypothetical protein
MYFVRMELFSIVENRKRITITRVSGLKNCLGGDGISGFASLIHVDIQAFVIREKEDEEKSVGLW